MDDASVLAAEPRARHDLADRAWRALHDGRLGEMTMHDATARWLGEQRQVVADVDRLIALYEGANIAA